MKAAATFAAQALRLAAGVAFFLVAFAAPATSALAQDDLIPLIVELLGDKDKDVRALAFEQIRTQALGETATRKFAELLSTLPPDTQVGLISALAARGDAAAAPAIRAQLAAKEEAARIAAIDALGYLGSEADVEPLVKLLSSGSAEEQKVARASLVRVAGEAASAAIVEQMQASPTPLRVTLIQILTERRAGVEELLKVALDNDAQVRSAAMEALGQIATTDHIAALVPAVLKAKPGSERNAAERALAAVCQRIADPHEQAVPLAAAMEKLATGERRALLPALGRVGGPAALKMAEDAFADDDGRMHSAGLAALCNWPDGSIAPRLLEIARTEEHADHCTQARKSLIRIAPLPDARTDNQRLDLLRTTLAMCTDDDERKLVLQRAKAIRTVDTLRFITPYVNDAKYREQACETIVELAHHSKLREPHKEEFHRALDKVIEVSKNATNVDRAQRYKKGQTWVRPKPAE